MAGDPTVPRRPDGGRPRSKVARVIEKYGLSGLGEELETRWLASGEDGMSLRELADYFNKRVLAAAIERSDMRLLETDVEVTYERLAGEEVSGGVGISAQRRLEREGIDVEAVRSDFVTHQSIHTYLREYREVTQPETTPRERRESALERIQKLQNRTVAVTEDSLVTLQRAELVPEGELDVVVDIQVIQADSGRQYDVFDFIEDADR